jgi:hypothetical protein
MDSFDSGQKPVTDFCRDGNEPSTSINGAQFDSSVVACLNAPSARVPCSAQRFEHKYSAQYYSEDTRYRDSITDV